MLFLNKTVNPPTSAQLSSPVGRGQRARLGAFALTATALALFLAGCGPQKPVGVVGHVEGFAGMTAADEPRAALVGQDVLSAGGSPADAAVAMAFTMAVTLPSQVSLGAGGACLVYDRDKEKVEALDFMARPPAEIGPGASRPSAVPALPRGLYALHSKYGRLRWEPLLVPAEGLARLGVPVSRALSQGLGLVAGPLFEDAEARAVFTNPAGTRRLEEGDLLTQTDLGATLSRLRQKGVGDFYNGLWAREIVAAVQAAGGTLTTEELRNFAPQWIEPVAVPYGNDTAYFVPPPAAAGLSAAQAWSILTTEGRYKQADAKTRPHLLAETLARLQKDRQGWMNPDGSATLTPAQALAAERLKQVMADYSPTAHAAIGGAPPTEPVAGAGLVAVAADGSAVSCAFSLNNTFGVGRVAPRTGIVLAAAPGVSGRGPQALVSMLAVNRNSNEFRFAATASGGAPAQAALLQVALDQQLLETPLDAALAARRLFPVLDPDAVFVEPGGELAGQLSAAGHQVREAALPGRVNAARCESGRPSLQRCNVGTDPRGAGLSLGK